MSTLMVTETKLLARSAEFVVVTLVMPVAFFLLFSEIFGSQKGSGGLDMAQYMMISMAAYGAISATLTTGSRVSLERKEGWLRQLRLTPLAPTSYVLTKAAVGMLVALPVIALVLLVGILVKGIDISVADAGVVLLTLWLCAIPFAALGVLFGMMASPEAASAITITGFLTFSVLGGLFIPYQVLPSVMQDVATYLPSFWMGEFARNAITGGALELKGFVVLVAWTVVAVFLVAIMFRKDSKRM